MLRNSYLTNSMLASVAEDNHAPGRRAILADTSSTPRASTLRFQGFTNRIIRTLLATPLLARAIGKKLVTLYVVGRKSGKRYTVPVAYTPDDHAMLIGTQFAWARNLRTG